eukprot:TRINITY_DN10506_c2_g1_i1.p1 TRINITY_DN10506_c2_g1~~TRINITY_DN10506_c2_g1_i1.p1  ORF type:complete len:158 (-),score=21.91 TRINITY_DN10506_c2_g1_i1:341-814(-)
MSNPFIKKVILRDESGTQTLDLFVTDRALRFSDPGEQNMRVFPKQHITSLVVDDTDLAWTDVDRPRALTCAGASSIFFGILSRKWITDRVKLPAVQDTVTVGGGVLGAWLGWKVAGYFCRVHHVIDGSSVKIRGAGGEQASFACGDAEARELVRLFA